MTTPATPVSKRSRNANRLPSVSEAQMGAIELHPWGSKVQRIDYPDRLIFDLDPDQGVPFDAVKLAAAKLTWTHRSK